MEADMAAVAAVRATLTSLANRREDVFGRAVPPNTVLPNTGPPAGH
jgi:hypothetical protein